MNNIVEESINLTNLYNSIVKKWCANYILDSKRLVGDDNIIVFAQSPNDLMQKINATSKRVSLMRLLFAKYLIDSFIGIGAKILGDENYTNFLKRKNKNGGVFLDSKKINETITYTIIDREKADMAFSDIITQNRYSVLSNNTFLSIIRGLTANVLVLDHILSCNKEKTMSSFIDEIINFFNKDGLGLSFNTDSYFSDDLHKMNSLRLTIKSFFAAIGQIHASMFQFIAAYANQG